MVMLKRFKESRDKREEIGAFFADLFKALDCIHHNLLVTKLPWYEVTPKSISKKNSYSRKSDIKYGVP